MDFAITEGSHFSHQLADHLHRCHMRVVPWEAATAERFDLAISPSSNPLGKRLLLAEFGQMRSFPEHPWQHWENSRED